jgi:hypothetical protein
MESDLEEVEDSDMEDSKESEEIVEEVAGLSEEGEMSESYSLVGKRYVELQNKIGRLLESNQNISLTESRSLAYDILKLTEEEKESLHGKLWTQHFIELICDYIRSKRENWNFLVVSILNITSEPVL